MDGAFTHPPARGPLEMWGGLECTVVRVNGAFRDQFQDTGHTGRIGDLAQAAALGIRTLRYPVGWERVCADGPDAPDWAWHDERLAELRRLGVDPIVGLVHHGSGPRHTCLEDPAFPDKLAAYAGAVARRYPWVTRWTPVNEPVTTARFSGLYGVWGPHRTSEGDFLRMLHHECRGVLLSMRAIRRAVPGAVLVQTEDLGRSFGTPEMQGRVDYENGWRWLSFDLLLGRVGRAHPWHRRFVAAGVAEGELEDYLPADAAPMVIGLNHYVTSERWLDHRLHLYPAFMHGGTAALPYVDTECLRVAMPEGETGWVARLREAAARYPGIPLAVTEAHLGCTPDEQARWLVEAWDAAVALRAEGAELGAVTAWSLFGAMDWCSLLTERRGNYEAGAFDASAATPRPTLLAEAVRALATSGRFDHPEAQGPGWWRRPERLHAFMRGC